MSIKSEIGRLSLAKEDIINALIEQGVEVPDNATLDDMGNQIRSIGGTGVVRYDEVQSLDASEQEQARQNIGISLPVVNTDGVLIIF